MAKLGVPSSMCAGLDVDGRRFTAHKGFVDVPDHLVGRLKANGECFEPSNQPRGRKGWRCPSCGFAGWFRECGRCGAAMTREV